MKRFYHYKTTLLFISLAMSLSILFGFSMARNITIETPIRIVDFTSMTGDQLLSWSNENDIKIITEEVYDDLVETGKVISQNVIVGERLFAGSTIKVTVSKGPDPEILVNLIDFNGKDIGEIQQFIETNRLLAASIEFEKSTDVNSAYFIRIDTTSTSVKRGQAIKFFISTGSKDELTTVTIPDFAEYTRQQISTWAQTNNIKTNFIDEFNNDIAQGKVISQSQAANTQVYDGSSITVKLSLGAGVVLENLVGKTKSTIDKFINDNGLKVNYTYSYSSSQNKDNGMSMSPTAATKVGNGSTVNVVLSLGKVSISDFKGKSLASLQTWISEVNKQGADLKVTSSQEYSEGTSSGLIITQTPSSGDINPGATIKATASKGAGIVVGTFVGTTKTSQEGLRVSTSSSYHGSVPSGQVISQSITAGSTVDNNTTISIVISKGKVQVGSYSSLSALESWKNSVNSEGGNISISTTEEWNSASIGTLLSHSNAGSSVNPGTNIAAVVSKGPSATVPNYVGGS
ncbi:MAG TPA: PASTA domain-containing protein, partial [Erysipelotrichaceae bacterium]|nr:PASTA domain-containing protein [Erysipelotrichaceae bacterium]